jgi:hypothetical protein
MTIYATGNPVGSTNPKDLIDNSQNLDYLVLGPLLSYPDRRGVNRLSWAGIEASFAAAQIDREQEFEATQVNKQEVFDAAQSARASEYASDKNERDTEYAGDKLERDTEFDADQANRDSQFNTFMDASGYEPPIAYGPGILLDRTTKTVSYLGNEYRAKGAFIPMTTSNWVTDEPKLKLIGDDSLRQELANAVDPAQGVGVLGTLRMGQLPGNDFNQALITGFYSAVGDGGDGLASANSPAESGNVRLDTIVLRGANSITQMAIAAGSDSAKFWFRSSFVSGGNYPAALASSPWKSMPTLQGNAVFKDLSTAVKSTVYIEHYGDGTSGSAQTYGIDIHNYPNAKSGLVLHQYSNNGPAFWLDNTDNAPAIRINNTHNFTLNPGGPVPTSLGDFQTWDTELVPKLRLKYNYVFEAYQVTPAFYRSEGTALSVQTPVDVAASTMTIVRTHNANAGAGLSVTSSGGSGISVNQTGPGVGLTVALQVGAVGFYAGQLAGNDYGAQVITSADGGRTLDVQKNGTGAGEAARITNKGTGVSLSVRDASAEVMSVRADGKLMWSTASNVQTGVGPSGPASPTPAAPAKYLKIVANDGNVYVIPAYQAS